MTGQRSRQTRTLLVIAGTLSVALGVLGMFLPVLPTTPFLLLAAWCYSRGSDGFYRRLLNNRWCGEYIRDYREGRGISARRKGFAIALLWLTIGYAAIFAVSAWWAKALLFGIAAGVSVHLLRMKTSASRG